MVEVVLDVGFRLDEAEPHTLVADVEVHLAFARTLEVEPGRKLGECGLETGDAQRDVLQRATLSRPVGCEERQLARAARSSPAA